MTNNKTADNVEQFFEKAADYKRLYKFISRVFYIICIEFIYIYITGICIYIN